MKNNRKIATSLTIATGITVLGVIGASDTAYADEVQTSEQLSIKRETVTPQKEVTKQNVNDAKDIVDNAQTTANEKDTAVSEAESELNIAKDNTAQAENDLNDAQDAHNNSTDKDVAQAEKDVVDAEKGVSDATTNHENAQNEASQAGQDETQAKTEYDSAKTESDNANNQVSEKETDVKEAESDVKDAEETVAKNETAVKDAEKDVEQKETNVEDAKNQLEEASKNDAESAKKTDEAKQDLNKAQQDKAEKEKAEKEASDKVSKQESTVNDAEDATKAAEEKLANQGHARYPETINLSQEWLDNFKKLNEAQTTSEKAKYRTILDTMVDSETRRLTEEFNKNNTLNKEETYDVNNLSEEMKKNLNLYLINLLNSIHDAMGDGKQVQANENLMNFADDIAKEYLKSDYKIGHNLDAINTAAEANGLRTHPTLNMYENLNLDTSYSAKVSEYYLYSIVYETISAMFVGDMYSNYNHGLNLINSDTLGMSFSFRKDVDEVWGIPDAYLTNIHIVNVAKPSNLVSTGTYDDTVKKYESLYGKTSSANLVVPDNDKEALEEAVKQAEANEAQAKADLAKMNTALSKAKEELSQSILEVAKAQSKYDALLNAPTTVNQAQKELDQAKKDLADAQAKLDKAVQSLQDSKNQLKGKQVHLSSAKEELEQAKEEQNTLSKVLESAKKVLEEKTNNSTNAKNKLAESEKALQDAHEKLSVAQKVLKALQDTGSALEEAQKAYEDALIKQQIAENNYVKAVAEANDAHDTLTKAKDEYNSIYSQYLLQQAIDGNKPDQELTPEPMPESTSQEKPSTSVKPGTVDSNVVPVKSNTSNNAVNTKKIANKVPNRFTSEIGKTLPQTGEESDSMLAKIGLGMLGVLMALVPFKLKNR